MEAVYGGGMLAWTSRRPSIIAAGAGVSRAI
jgi:hypothetical protein